MTLIDINSERSEINEGQSRESIFQEVVNFCEGPIITADSEGLVVSFNRFIFIVVSFTLFES